MRAVVDGGLESALDEHFWLRAQNLQEGAAGLAKDLQAALTLRAGSFNFHSVGGKHHKIQVRCHAAVPFGDAEDADRKGVGEGKSVSTRVDLGGRRIIKKKKKK